MRKRIYFGPHDGAFWPPAADLEQFFLTTKAQDTLYESGNDSYGIDISGLYNTEDKPDNVAYDYDGSKSAASAHLSIWFDPQLGVSLHYRRSGPGLRESLCSKGDLTQFGVYTRTLHQDLMPVALYIPAERAWLAVKEFMEREGEIPTSIDWIASADLPPNTFVVPHEKVTEIETTGYPWDRVAISATRDRSGSES